jgi:uncharacterized protein YqiB (DUF1249 family)
MAECDANYLRMLKVFPRLKEEDSRVFGVVIGGHAREVRIDVIERGPYTTLVRLRQLPETAWGISPSMTVRLYHDARNAEIVEYQHARRFQAVYGYPNAAMRSRDEKAQVNRLLGEFLALCLASGMAVRERALEGISI